MPSQNFAEQLLLWYAQHGRKNLPWQAELTPYKVWLSEIMLQQTQVSTVIPYFLRFVARFPDIESLAAAELDEVLSYWAGLGYYARARNLHKTAQLISSQYQGQFPGQLAALMALPGIGRSTAGAILSIAFRQSQPILDGNVKRVLTRCFAVAGWPGDTKVEQELWLLSTQLTPKIQTAEYTQAIMDLGATLCTRTQPNCAHCPLQSQCLALGAGNVHAYPTPKPRQTIPIKHACMLLLNVDSCVYLERRPELGIWGGLWTLPEFANHDAALAWCAQQGLEVVKQAHLAVRRHTFSHYHLDYTILQLTLAQPMLMVAETKHAGWYNFNEVQQLGLPAPVNRLLQQFFEEALRD